MGDAADCDRVPRRPAAVRILLLQSAYGRRIVGHQHEATCSKAAIGSETRDYRAYESVHIRWSYLPPSAICEWSGGATAALVPANALSWAGPVLIAASVLRRVR